MTGFLYGKNKKSHFVAKALYQQITLYFEKNFHLKKIT